MAPWMHGVVGNPSGSHRAARAARRAVEEARDEVAALSGVKPGNVIFTAGGTESCTLAVAGFVRHHRRSHERSVVVVSPVEHHAVGDAAAMLAEQYDDVDVRYLRVDGDGVVDLESLATYLTDPDVALVSVMAANNETGVLEPLDAIGALTRELGVTTHSDAVAAAPWCDLSATGPLIDMLSVCAHKLGGPVNAGALLLRRDVLLEALAPGGGQERGRRGGTVDVAACVGLATALRLCASERDATNRLVSQRRDFLSEGLARVPGATLTALGAAKVPGTVHVTFDGVASDELLFLLDQAGVCASAAASCSSGAAVASHVLAAMGVAPSRAKGSLRLSMGAENSDDDVRELLAIVTTVVERLRHENRLS